MIRTYRPRPLPGAGAFEQAHVTMTRGIHVGDRPDAAERIAAQRTAQREPNGLSVPVAGPGDGHRLPLDGRRPRTY